MLSPQGNSEMKCSIFNDDFSHNILSSLVFFRRRPSPYVACGCGCKCFPSLHSIVKCSRADALDVSDTSSNSSGSYNDGKSGNFPDEPPVPRALEVPALRHDFGGHSRSDSVTSSPCSGASLVRAKAPRARTVPPRTPTRR